MSRSIAREPTCLACLVVVGEDEAGAGATAAIVPTGLEGGFGKSQWIHSVAEHDTVTRVQLLHHIRDITA